MKYIEIGEYAIGVVLMMMFALTTVATSMQLVLFV